MRILKTRETSQVKYVDVTNNLFSNILSVSLIVLFFLMMVVPRTYLLLKVPFLSFALFLTVFSILSIGKVRMHRKIVFWFMIYVIFGILWGVFGLINEKEFAMDFLRLNTLWVLIYLLLVVILSKPEHIEMAEKVMIWAALAIAIYNINFVLYSMGYLHIPLIIDLDMGQLIGIHAGYTQLTAHNIGSLTFLVPFIFCGIAINPGKYFAGLPKWFVVVVFVLSLIAVFLSGRRALWLITIMAPVLYFFIIRITTKSHGRFKQLLPLFIIGIVIVLGQYFLFEKAGWDSNDFIGRLNFSGEQGEGANYRINKTIELVDDVYKHNLLLGTGGGDPAFEILFVQIFHETGFIGLLIYISLFIWVYFKMFRIIKQKKGNIEQGIPLLVGSLSFFFGILSNPYFGSFDFMWGLCLPVAYVNVYLRGIKG